MQGDLHLRLRTVLSQCSGSFDLTNNPTPHLLRARCGAVLVREVDQGLIVSGKQMQRVAICLRGLKRSWRLKAARRCQSLRDSSASTLRLGCAR